MHKLMSHALKTFASSCEQATTVHADFWCEKYRRYYEKNIIKPWSFRMFPWTREMVKAENEECVGRKAAQMGYTEVALNRSFFTLIKLRRDVLYVLPAKTPDATDFSVARFDPAIASSPLLSEAFSKTNNVGLKKAGSNVLYVRGSRSRNQLKSVPVSFLVLDEVEEMEDDAISLAKARTWGQNEFQCWALSTPSIPGIGIDFLFEQSSQDLFVFPCPHCSRWTDLSYPDSLVIVGEHENDPRLIESHIICKHCKSKLNHVDKPDFLARGKWEPQFKDRTSRGFYINQLYSCVNACQPHHIAKDVFKARRSPSDEQELYNSRMGLPHIVAGANVSISTVLECKQPYRMMDPKLLKGIVTIGIDVGTELHIVAKHWRLDSNGQTNDINLSAIPAVILATTVKDFADLNTIMYKLKPVCTVIDHQPETRAALSFARLFPKESVFLCHYITGGSVRELTVRDEENITVDRTSWLDLTLSRYTAKTILLPEDLPVEFAQHVANLVRVNARNKQTGEDRAIYRRSGPDHYEHADVYSEIAFKKHMMVGSSSDITERVW